MAGDFSKILKSISSAISILKSDDDSGAKLEKEITLRDNMYTILLKDYVRISRYRNIIKEIHKWVFFWLIITASIVGLVYIGKIVVRFLEIENTNELVKSIPVLITAIVSFISTIIIIPATITKFLFNTKEDENITSVIVHTQEHDTTGITLLKNRFEKQREKIISDTQTKMNNTNELYH